jgi:hypothetical protein
MDAARRWRAIDAKIATAARWAPAKSLKVSEKQIALVVHQAATRELSPAVA